MVTGSNVSDVNVTSAEWLNVERSYLAADIRKYAIIIMMEY